MCDFRCPCTRGSSENTPAGEDTFHNGKKLLPGIAIILLVLQTTPSPAAKEFRISDYFSREEIETASRYNKYLYTIFFLKQFAVVSFLGLVAFSRLGSSYKRDVERLCCGKKRIAFAVYIFFIVLMMRLVILPFDAVRDLVVKSAFGLTNQKVAGWLADQAKGFLVADLWYVPFVALVYAAMRRLRRTWWLISAGAVGLALVAWYSLAPYLIEPLFYRLTPFKSKSLKNRLYPLLRKSRLEQNLLYEADSGKRTKEVNAYTSGLFLGKRIVLYDVLVGEAEPSEIEFVVAHEIAHLKMNHILLGIVLGTGGAAGILFVTGALLKLSARRKTQEDRERLGANSVPVFFFWLHVILFFIMPIECAISRRFERSADRDAIKLTQDPKGAAWLFEKVARKNLADLDPPAIAKFWLYTHPPILERIEAALKMANEADNTRSTHDTTAAPEKRATPSLGNRRGTGS